MKRGNKNILMPVLPHVIKDKRKKVTSEMILQMNQMRQSGDYTLADLVKKFKLNVNTVRYHTEPDYRKYVIELHTKQVQNKRKTNPVYKEREARNKKKSFDRLMKIPGNRKKWNNYINMYQKVVLRTKSEGGN